MENICAQKIAPKIPPESEIFKRYKCGQIIKTSKMGLDGFSYQTDGTFEKKEIEIFMNPEGEILYAISLSAGSVIIIGKATRQI